MSIFFLINEPSDMVLILNTDDLRNISQVGTKATKYKSQIKSHIDQSAADSSCRGPGQVLACSVLGVALQLVHVYYYGEEQSIGTSLQ